MADLGHKKTDENLERLEHKIRKEYKQAADEIGEKTRVFMSKFEDADKKKQALVDAGKMTDTEYKRWRLNNVAMGKNWEQMKETLSDDWYNADKIARKMVSKDMIDVYALNHNFAAYQIEHETTMKTSFQLYNHEAVERLLRDEPQILPDPGKKMARKIAEGKAKKWSQKKLQSIMTQSILQGESIPHIAERLTREMGEISAGAAIRSARTMTTAAEAAGRIDAYEEAVEMGIKAQQMWVATLDNRTRHEHALLDGQIVDVGEPFVVDGIEIMFPGDPDCDEPSMIYNCRCTVIPVVEGSDLAEKGIEGMERDSKLGDMSYEEWKEMKQIEVQVEEPAEQEQQTKSSNVEVTELARELSVELAPWPGEYASYEEYAEAKSNSNGDNRFVEDSNWIISLQDAESAKRFDHTIAVMMEQYPTPNDEHIAIGNYELMVDRLSERQKQFAVHTERDVKGQLWHTDEGYIIGYRPTSSPADFDIAGRQGGSLMVGGVSPETTAVHEYGHIMQEYISRSQYTDGVEDVTGDVLRLWRERKDEIETQLSQYATENISEMMAECFTQCALYEEPSEIAMEYGDLLTQSSLRRITFPFQRKRKKK